MRIKVDLSEFLEDERKFAVVNVNLKECVSVRDVLSRISKLFNVSTDDQPSDGVLGKKPTLGLFEDEFYIHPDETSTVLQDMGVLKLKSLPKSGGSEADGRRKKKAKKGTAEEEYLHPDGDRKERKSIREKTDDDIQSKEEKKEKRSRLAEEFTILDNEDDDKRKTRKRKRHKTSEETTELVLDVDEVKEQRKSKKSRINEERLEPMSEEKGRWKKGKSTEKTAEPKENTDEVKEKKKFKKDKVIESAVESGDEIEVLVKEKKKRKKEKAVEANSAENVMKDIKKKKSRSAEQSLILETKESRRKMRKNSKEDEDIPPVHDVERKNSKCMEEKSSQEKVVSTSTVINLESEETSDNEDSPDASRKYEKQGSFNTRYSDQDGDYYVADSVTGPSITHDFEHFSNAGNRKRKRKHNRKHRAHEEVNEKSASADRYISHEKLSAPAFHMNDSKHNFPHSSSRNTRPLLNSNFTQRKHIHFTSDDEKEVTSAFKGDIDESAHEIEIVEPTTRVPRRNEVGSGTVGQKLKHMTGGVKSMSSGFYKPTQSSEDSPSYMYRFGKDVFHSTPVHKEVPLVVEVEEGASPVNHVEHSSYNVSGRNSLHRNKECSFDELDTLRRICKNRTLTVCKVDSRNDQVKIKPKEAPAYTPASPYLRPPSPVFTSPRKLREETKQTFHNFMTIRNRTMPLVFSNTRKVQRDSSTDSKREKPVGGCFSSDRNRAVFNNSFPTGSKSFDGQDSPLRSALSTLCMSDRGDSYQNLSERVESKKELDQTPCQSRNENSHDLSSVPSTSKWVRVSDDTPKERVSIASQPRRRDKPRVIQSLGAVLSKIRNQVDSGNDAGELLVLSNDEAESLPQGETGREALFINESNTDKIAKSKTNERPHESPHKKIDNEVVDLESEEECALPVISNRVSGFGSGLDIIEHYEARAASTDKVFPESKNTANPDNKKVENKNKESFAIDMKLHNKRAARYDDIVDDDKSSDIDAEIIEDKQDAAEMEKDRRKTTSFAADIVENVVKSTESTSRNVEDEEMVDIYADIEGDQEGSDFDAEIVEEEEEEVEEEEVEEEEEEEGEEEDEEEEVETTDVTKIQEHIERNTNVPVSTAAAAVHELDDVQKAMEDIVNEGLKEDMLKEVKLNSLKDGEQVSRIDESYFEKFPVMKNPAKAGEYIAVKKLSFDDFFRPVYSNYIQAYVVDVDGLKVTLKYVDKLKLRKDSFVDQNKKEVEEVDLTFEEDEVDLIEEEDTNAVMEELDWRDLYEPRLIFP